MSLDWKGIVNASKISLHTDQETLLLEVGNLVGHEVVESVVASLQRLLVGQTRLLKQVNHLEHVQSKKSNKKLLCTCANV